MSRLLRLLLLVSIGLNLGLGWALLQDRAAGRAREGHPHSERAWRERPAPDDSVAWRRVMDRRLERLSAKLALEPAQAEQLQRLQLDNGPLMQAARQRVTARREAVRAAVDAGAAGDAMGGGSIGGDHGVREALRALRRAQADLDSLAQEFLLQEFAVLTPEQRGRYARLLPLDPWRGDGPRGPGGPGEGPRHGGGRRRAAE